MKTLPMTSEDFEDITRQNTLARYIGTEFCGCDELIPLGRHSSYVVAISPPKTRGHAFAWWCIGRHIEAAANRAGSHVIIDHAWLAGLDKTNEPLALVTEPYIAEATAQQLVGLASEAMANIGVTVHLLPASASSWNPLSCRPIVVVLYDKERFVRLAAEFAT
jgi:hypothetical protein